MATSIGSARDHAVVPAAAAHHHGIDADQLPAQIEEDFRSFPG
jgi:hypothetical protein